MQMKQTFTPHSRVEWRAWLEAHYIAEKEVWLVYAKPHTGQPTISYDESVEEALCFGWIDSIIQKIDDDTYARKFNPRSSTAKWSPSNVERLRRLVADGRMTPAGLAKVDPGVLDGSIPLQRAPEFEIPQDILDTLHASPAAWENYQKLNNSTRKRYMGWVLSAKRDETRRARLKEVLHALETGQPMGLK